MSRSYRKYYKVTQEKEDYRYLNRQLRHDKLAEIPKGGGYRRIYPSCEWSYLWTKEQATRQYKESERVRKMYATLDDWLNYWASCVKRK